MTGMKEYTGDFVIRTFNRYKNAKVNTLSKVPKIFPCFTGSTSNTKKGVCSNVQRRFVYPSTGPPGKPGLKVSPFPFARFLAYLKVIAASSIE